MIQYPLFTRISIEKKTRRKNFQSGGSLYSVRNEYLYYCFSPTSQLSSNICLHIDLNTAATVLLAARLQPKVEEGVADNSTDTSLARAIEVLSMFKVYSQSARRSLAALEVLSTKVRQHVLGLRDGDSEPDEPPGPRANVEQRFSTNAGNGTFNESLDGFDFSEMPEGFDLGFDLNLNDMSWLNSLPGML
jgi:hypothetical protein